MKKFIALFLVFSLLALSGNLIAKERRGAELIVVKKDGQQLRGELIAVKQTSLLLKDSDSGTDVTVDIEEVSVITIVKKSKFKLGAGLGLLIGGVIGAMAISPEATEASEPLVAAVGGIGGVFKWVGNVAIVGLSGSIIGGFIGAAAGTDKIIQIEGKSDSEIQEILEKLRKKARVRNFQ